MLYRIKLEQILFLDIETVPETRDFEDLSTRKQQLWDEKTRYRREDGVDAAEFYEKAGVWAEFGKIICISVGYFNPKGKQRSFRIKTFHGDEKQLLIEFIDLIDKHFNRRDQLLCAHNGKEFDFPYLARRMLINGLKLPGKLNLFGKKPWEVPHLDTMDLWKFGDYKHYTSLKLLAEVLGIPSPKEDMDGSMVRGVYYDTGDIDSIIAYCETDVLTLAQLILRLKQEPLLKEEEVVSL